jgi:biofilm protein TabA
MILDDLKLADRYIALHPGFAAGFAALRRPDLASLDVGRHVLDGDRLFMIVGRDAGRGQTGARLEAHRRYIDIQYVISGREEIGWRPTAECSRITEAYSDERDLMFFGDSSESWFKVLAGKFAIFFPEDAHAPLAGTGSIHKAVIKVAISGW